MDVIWEFIKNNYQWIFAGIGVVFLSFIFGKKIIKKKITTHGDQSPGEVHGNYTATKTHAEKKERDRNQR